jgi:hypothetical protein
MDIIKFAAVSSPATGAKLGKKSICMLHGKIKESNYQIIARGWGKIYAFLRFPAFSCTLLLTSSLYQK